MWPNTIAQIALYILTINLLKYFNEEYEIKWLFHLTSLKEILYKI